VAGLGADPGLGYAPVVRTQAAVRLADGVATADEAIVAEEVPVAFVYSGKPHVVMMCTPADIEDLGVGFSITEGIVASASEIGELEVIRHSRGIELHLQIPDDALARLADRTRALAGRTGCGLCGVEAIDDAVRAPSAVQSALRFEQSALWRAAGSLDAHQVVNRDTHAVHAAAWATPDGVLHCVREDVGRHNALDKVFGALARAGTDARGGFILITSRASFELVQKCAISGVPLLAAVSRPTGLAVRIAERSNIALVGLLRGRSANVYAHAERIV